MSHGGRHCRVLSHRPARAPGAAGVRARASERSLRSGSRASVRPPAPSDDRRFPRATA